MVFNAHQGVDLMRMIEIEVTEILQRKVQILVPDGATAFDALSQIEEKYETSQLILDDKDFVDVSFGIVN